MIALFSSFQSLPDQIIIIYTLMGNQSKSAQLNIIKSSSIQQKYLTKLFIRNKKSNNKFKQEIASICKRSSYLQYSWTKQLLQQLKNANLNQLYSEYQSILKENCLREGQKEKIFCPANIQSQFIKQFTDKLKNSQSEPSLQFLNSAFEECKCYFMVMSWLHKMVTLSANDKQNKGRLVVDWDQSQQEHIFDALLNLSLKTYRTCNNFKGEQIQFGAKKNETNQKISRLMKKIMMHNLNFLEKEEIIANIQLQLQADINHIDENVMYLKSVMGLGQIFAYLTTIRQVGHIDVTFLLKYFNEQVQ